MHDIVDGTFDVSLSTSPGVWSSIADTCP